jgi:hypothetical protein
MRVIICGARDYKREVVIQTFLDGLYKEHGDKLYVIEGGAKGADRIADEWCQKNWTSDHRNHWQCCAEWEVYKEDGTKYTDKQAGHIRNKKMLDEGKPDIVFAFKDDFNWKLDKGGTENMVKIAAKAGVPTYVVQKVEV